jgi:hypothetical protein
LQRSLSVDYSICREVLTLIVIDVPIGVGADSKFRLIWARDSIDVGEFVTPEPLLSVLSILRRFAEASCRFSAKIIRTCYPNLLYRTFMSSTEDAIFAKGKTIKN